MDFALTAEQRRFRQWVRAQLAEPDIRTELDRWYADSAREPDVRPLYRALGARGLLAVNWPKEYGGADLSLVEATIAAEEMTLAGVPDLLYVNTVQIVGLFLLLAGTEEQKARYLPPIAAGRCYASVLYTEPEAGSDLAGLRTTAVPDGAGYRINGVKMFSLKGDITDIGLCAARTSQDADRYHGISLFLVDMRAEGIHRRTVASIADEQFHRVELRDVYVGADRLVGVLGQGWPLVTQALAIERTGLDYSLRAERWYRAVLGTGPGPDRHEEMGRYGAAVRASRLLSWQMITALDDPERGDIDETLAAAAKWYASELAQDIAHWAVRQPAPAGAGDPTSPARLLDAAYREAPGVTLAAGTSQVMLQIIASAPEALEPRLVGGAR